MTNQVFVEQLEQKRDLKTQLGGLAREDESGIVFEEWSPGRTMVKLWSTETGEEINIPRYMAEAALGTRRADGKGYRFTSHQEQAPAFRMGTVKCFLHAEAAERELVISLGIGKTCPAEHLASPHAKRVHAEKRHRSEWAMYQEHVRDEEQKAWRQEQRQQTDAMMAMAGKAAGKVKRDAPSE